MGVTRLISHTQSVEVHCAPAPIWLKKGDTDTAFPEHDKMNLSVDCDRIRFDSALESGVVGYRSRMPQRLPRSDEQPLSIIQLDDKVYVHYRGPDLDTVRFYRLRAVDA